MLASSHNREARWPLTGDSSLGAVIEAFLRATDPAAELRELRGALSHVDAELGSMAVRAVRSRHITAMLDGLGRAGLSSRRETAVIEALHSLYAFALARRLVAVDPVRERASTPRYDRPRRQATPRPTRTLTPTRRRNSTLSMLAFGARVAFWTTWIIMLAFCALLLAFVVEFA